MSYMPSTVTNDVTVSATQPNPPTDIWIDTASSGGTTADFVLKSGDKMTGSLFGKRLEIDEQFRLSKDTLGVASSVRWQLYRYGTETGANAGSDLVLGNVGDDGTYLGNPFYITRSSGAVYIPNLQFSDQANISLSAGWALASTGYAMWLTKHAGMITIELNIKRTASLTLALDNLLGTVPVGFRPAGTGSGVCTFIGASKFQLGALVVRSDGNVYLSQTSGVASLAVGDWLQGTMTYRQGG